MKSRHASGRTGVARTRDGFTLIELLVVIGIISVLISILLPSLSAARKTAHAVKCQTNIKQLMLAVVMYGTDNRDLMPYTNSFSGETGSPAQWPGKGWLYQRSLVNWSTVTVDDAETGAIYEYLQTTRTLHCPLADPPEVANNSVKPMTSYVMSRAMNGWNATLPQFPAFRTFDLKTDAMAFFEADEEEDSEGGDWNDGNNDPDQTVSRRHNRGGVLGFVDGHAEQITIFDYEIELGDTPGRLWANPLTPHGGDPANPPAAWTGG